MTGRVEEIQDLLWIRTDENGSVANRDAVERLGEKPLAGGEPVDLLENLAGVIGVAVLPPDLLRNSGVTESRRLFGRRAVAASSTSRASA